jgi:anaerobic ribonucleoside-triphosphate reductase
MKQNTNDNAANRTSYVGNVYSYGERSKKAAVLNSIKPEWKHLHENGYIHIHDLDAYGITYNCLTFNLVNHFPYKEFEGFSTQRKILRLFDFLKDLFTNIGNEQSGGMAFANFDEDMAKILNDMGVRFSENNKELIRDCISELILWCNDTHTRMGKTSYYVSFNIGLATSDDSRFIAETLIDEFNKAGDLIYKPNIIFKVCQRINGVGTANHYLLEKALSVTAKKMIPTYLLCDCKEDKNIDPYKLSVMGCRTRVVDDLYGNKQAIGRGNIDNISINLPRIALEIDKEHHDDTIEEKVSLLYQKWDEVAVNVKDILIDRFDKVCHMTKEDFPTNLKYQLWIENFNEAKSLYDIFKHGTLSIGFIGLSEAIEVLTGEKYYLNDANYEIAMNFLKHMREYCNNLRDEYKLNFSLLATSGELISGRFIEIDKKEFNPQVDIFSKGFYTNSFHVNVDSNLPGYKKIQIEGPFHELCNGGSITYLELGEAPISNVEGLKEYINIAIKAGVHYLGFNFPKDICSDCKTSGIFDVCPVCGSKNITRIRRVSGYLEILDGFTKGKKAEEKSRRAN